MYIGGWLGEAGGQRQEIGFAAGRRHDKDHLVRILHLPLKGLRLHSWHPERGPERRGGTPDTTPRIFVGEITCLPVRFVTWTQLSRVCGRTGKIKRGHIAKENHRETPKDGKLCLINEVPKMQAPCVGVCSASRVVLAGQWLEGSCRAGGLQRLGTPGA